VKENGKVAVQFDGSGDVLFNTVAQNSFEGVAQAFTMLHVAQTSNTSNFQYSFSLLDGSNSTLSQNDQIGILAANDNKVGAFIRDFSTSTTSLPKSSATVGTAQHLNTAISTGSNLSVYADGTAGDSVSISYPALAFDYASVGGRYGGSTPSSDTLWSGKIQEIIAYASDKSKNRSDIEENIGDYFTQNTPLLDTYTGASAAYSLRKLSSSYSGPLIRVREDGNDTTLDIYSNIFGELDTVALANHCQGRNGLVTGWSDQSGNLITAQSPFEISQPKIYDATTGVVTDANGKPTMVFDGSDSYFITAVSLSQPITASMVAKVDDTDINYFFDGDDATNRVAIFQNSSSFGFTAFSGASLPSNVKDTNQNLHFLLYNGTSSAYHLNGNSIASGNAGTNIADNVTIGARYNLDGNKLDGQMQELVFWESNESFNREGIEDNINTFYDIYDTGLIGEYPGASAAYSLRSLSSLYDGAAITVRRASDDSTKNIYFDSDGNLDTADLIGFCTNTNGYIVRWFDQSGNGNHATQSADTSQPQIYKGNTGVVTENGKPAVEFDGSNDYFESSNVISGTTARSIFSVNNDTGGTDSTIYTATKTNTGQGTRYSFATNVNAANIFVSVKGGNSAGPYTGNSQHSVSNFLAASSDINTLSMFVDGSALTLTTSPEPVNTHNNNALIGATEGITNYWNGTQQELIIYTSDESSNRTGIESNINKNYLIYQPSTAPTSGLLADYSGAAAAYSLRQLSNEAVMAVKVRRDSDDAQVAIGFVGGDLDTVSLSAFCGTSDGFVAEWVDQSTNGNNATQGADTSQPKIYDGTTGVVTENGKPAVQFDGSNDELAMPSYPFTQSDIYIASIAKHTDTTTEANLYNFSDASTIYALGFNRSAGSTYGATRFVSAHEAQGDSYNQTQSLFSQVYASSTTSVYKDAVQGTQSYNCRADFNKTSIGSRDGAFFLNGNIQEIVLYDSDQSSNRTGIEDNIFSHYSPAPLLDTYSGAAAAYSLRKLSSSATNAVEVRRDSDDSTQYIGFVQDALNGESLDTAALSAFCGSANGFVTEWVDQSTNGNNATQGADTSQPKIYDGTTGVVTENGKLAIDFDGSNDFLDVPSAQWTDGEMMSCTVITRDAGNSTYWNAGVIFRMFYETGKHGFIHYGTTPNETAKGSSPASPMLTTSRFGNGSSDLYENSVSVGSNSVTGLMNTSSSVASIGQRSNGANRVNGRIQELIHWSSDQSSNRTNIEDNINTFYDIY
jgi:hypothetical protein